jgi:hypothetical protein
MVAGMKSWRSAFAGHRIMRCYFPRRFFIGSSVLVLPIIFLSDVGADIKGSSLASPTVLSREVKAEVDRGGEIELSIPAVSIKGGEVSVQILRQPNCGTLQEIGRGDGTVPFFKYQNIAPINSPNDSFDFRIKIQGQAWSRKYTASIRIKNPPGKLCVIPDRVDFGAVPVGTSVQRIMLLSNSFGAPVSGVLLLPSPWTLVGDGAFSLCENETKAFTLVFTPVKARSEVAELKVAPVLSNFPVVPLIGEGVVPFLIDSTSTIVTKEHPRADFRITNASTREMKVGWDDDTGLLSSPPVTIPPGGTSKVWISIAPLPLDSEERKVIHPSLREGNFSLPIEIVALGPKGNISLKADEKTFSCKVGSQVTLHGMIESTSSMERTLQLHTPDKDGGPEKVQNVTIAPHGFQPLVYSWSSQSPGPKTLKASLFESGKLLQRAEWIGTVTPLDEREVHQPSPSSRSVSGIVSGSSTNTPQVPKSQSVRLTRKDSGCVAAKLSAVLQPGFFTNSLLLKWLYFGDGSPLFVVEEKIKRNGLTDRTGDNPGVMWRMLDLKPKREHGAWSAWLPMLWPGMHFYRVYPTGCPVVIMSEVMVPVTWAMFLWPSVRAALIILFVLSLIKVLRERL